MDVLNVAKIVANTASLSLLVWPNTQWKLFPATGYRRFIREIIVRLTKTLRSIRAQYPRKWVDLQCCLSICSTKECPLITLFDIQERSDDRERECEETTSLQQLVVTVVQKVLLLVWTPKVRRKACIVFFLWSATGMIYYGVSLNSYNLRYTCQTLTGTADPIILYQQTN